MYVDPKRPRKAIPVMGISGRENEPCPRTSRGNRNATWRKRGGRGSLQKKKNAKEVAWFLRGVLFELARPVARFPQDPESRTCGWTCIAGHLFSRRWKMLFLSEPSLAHPGQCLDSTPTHVFLNWRTYTHIRVNSLEGGSRGFVNWNSIQPWDKLMTYEMQMWENLKRVAGRFPL